MSDFTGARCMNSSLFPLPLIGYALQQQQIYDLYHSHTKNLFKHILFLFPFDQSNPFFPFLSSLFPFFLSLLSLMTMNDEQILQQLLASVEAIRTDQQALSSQVRVSKFGHNEKRMHEWRFKKENLTLTHA